MAKFFDAEGFYLALDAHRQARGIPWKRVADEAGVPPSTLTRMGQRRKPDVDSLAALAAWSGIDVRKYYVAHKEQPPETLAEISALLRADQKLSGEGAAMLERVISSLYRDLRNQRED